ncbi:Alpha/Beta hydrolase protein [Apodospora peruviana]|uniref:Alpha/Beta hydrolase protein n=1 Tax=Apodospora peruviana TaxID=516989 RepID=A0AAE0HXN3_9PEZI|nr:Alpha/Beta hydrolase protein [Apodospora peruviana]
MFNFYLSYKYLHWRTPASDGPLQPSTLPDNITRFFIPTKGGNGNIEILYAAPKTTNNDPPKSPIFFVHGGMGGAFVWLEYMTYLSARGIPCYAVSMRGHGNSWYPSFLRMVYGTTKRMLADDIVTGIRWAQDHSGGQEIVLVGHSSGGGLCQFVLSEQEVKVKGLVLAAAVPGCGSMGVYWNWFKLDPWFTLRMLFHGWHPNSPLSHPALIRRVFFSAELTGAYVERFMALSSPYESFLWPLGMGYPFVSATKVLQQIMSRERGESIMVLCGGGDKIMTRSVMEKLAGFYRGAYAKLVGQKKVDGETTKVEGIEGEGGEDTAGQGVRFCVVSGAAHHLQNDVQWEIGARKLLEFYEKL